MQIKDIKNIRDVRFSVQRLVVKYKREAWSRQESWYGPDGFDSSVDACLCKLQIHVGRVELNDMIT